MSTPEQARAKKDAEVRSFVDAVAGELDDLQPDERSDLLDDLSQHVREVAAEGDGSLEERLGSPAAYAAELREAADLPVRSERGRLMSGLRATPVVRSIVDFLPELRPGWWVARGALLVVAVGLIAAAGDVPIGLWIAAIGALVWGSVALGRASRTNVVARRVSAAASIAVVALGVVAIGNTRDAGPGGQMVAGPVVFTMPGPADADICAPLVDGVPLPALRRKLVQPPGTMKVPLLRRKVQACIAKLKADDAKPPMKPVEP